ncbi:hypothetical protein F5Y10DRAFT_232958 [Nemania abortiva]|nr:hypothetical protein F5Y10DRAFT_232958 [Nemania abortiva]
MPPKRKPQDDISSGSESDPVVLQRPTVTEILPKVMQNIEMLTAKRDRGRKKISAGFDTYIAGRKKEIEERYTSEARKRSTEAKTLLTRYVEALEERASIEKSIEEMALDAREDLQELMIILEAAYSGRQQQCKAAAGSFASLEPVPAKGAAVNKVTPDMRDEIRAGKDYIGDTKRQDENQGRDYIFDEILW